MKDVKNNRDRKKLKWWIKTLIVFGCIIAFIGVVLLGAIAYFRISVSNYYKASEKAFIIPEIHSGVVPQGFDYDAENKLFLVSGYMKDGSASPVYAVDKNTGKTTKKVFFNTDNGKYTGHAGGIAVYKDFFYIADDAGLLVYRYSDILNAKWGGTVECLSRFSTALSTEDYVGVSCVSVSGDRLIVGEFYREGDYPTPKSHKIKTTAGDYNQAIGLEYALSESYPYGIASTPTKAFSLPDQVQGMLFTNGKIYLSTSWGVSFSHIYEYDESALVRQSDITILGTTLPLYAMDSASLLHDYKIAPMSEEMVMVDGFLYVMNESACTKYLFGNLIGGKWCYKTDLSKMK